MIETSHRFASLLAHPAVQLLRKAAAGRECLLVGGTLRDHALSLPYHDLDAVVAGGAGRQVAERLAATLPARLVHLGGKEFAAFRLVGHGIEIDLWDREGMSRYADLARRDLTVNAIALDVSSGEVLDPFGGLGDLDRRRLRAVTVESFTGDPLRVLRLPRLLLQLPGFTADPATIGLARRASTRLSEMAAERIRDELAKLLAHRDAARGLAILGETGVYPELWLGRGGNDEDREIAAAAVAGMSALAAAADAVTELASDLPPPRGEALPAARFAATFAALPESIERLERFRDVGYLTRRTASDVAQLLAIRKAGAAPPEDDRGGRRLLHRLGSALWQAGIAFLGADPAAAGAAERWRRALPPLIDLARREGGALFAPPRLLTGVEVQELLSLPPGPRIGGALAALTAAQVEGTVRSRDEAVAFVLALPREVI